MQERAQELKQESRRGARSKKVDGERDVLAKIAEMAEGDRSMAERLHALIGQVAPNLSPKTWYGMPAYAGADGKAVCFFQAAASSSRGTRRWASTTSPRSTMAPCGRPRSRSRS
jgi:hypothetical protein